MASSPSQGRRFINRPAQDQLSRTDLVLYMNWTKAFISGWASCFRSMSWSSVSADRFWSSRIRSARPSMRHVSFPEAHLAPIGVVIARTQSALSCITAYLHFIAPEAESAMDHLPQRSRWKKPDRLRRRLFRSSAYQAGETLHWPARACHHCAVLWWPGH